MAAKKLEWILTQRLNSFQKLYLALVNFLYTKWSKGKGEIGSEVFLKTEISTSVLFHLRIVSWIWQFLHTIQVNQHMLNIRDITALLFLNILVCLFSINDNFIMMRISILRVTQLLQELNEKKFWRHHKKVSCFNYHNLVETIHYGINSPLQG